MAGQLRLLFSNPSRSAKTLSGPPANPQNVTCSGFFRSVKSTHAKIVNPWRQKMARAIFELSSKAQSFECRQAKTNSCAGDYRKKPEGSSNHFGRAFVRVVDNPLNNWISFFDRFCSLFSNLKRTKRGLCLSIYLQSVSFETGSRLTCLSARFLFFGFRRHCYGCHRSPL